MYPTLVTPLAVNEPAGGRAAGIGPDPDSRHDRYAADLRIDGWLVQPSLNLLTRPGARVRLRAQLIDLLLCLASRPSRVFTKEDLVADVWQGRWIAPSALSRCVAELRAALGDDAKQPRVIETITKRGYRLIAPVEVVAADAAPCPVRAAAPTTAPSPVLAAAPTAVQSPVVAAAATPAPAEPAPIVTPERPRSFWHRLRLSAMRATADAG